MTSLLDDKNKPKETLPQGRSSLQPQKNPQSNFDKTNSVAAGNTYSKERPL